MLKILSNGIRNTKILLFIILYLQEDNKMLCLNINVTLGNNFVYDIERMWNEILKLLSTALYIKENYDDS